MLGFRVVSEFHISRYSFWVILTVNADFFIFSKPLLRPFANKKDLAHIFDILLTRSDNTQH